MGLTDCFGSQFGGVYRGRRVLITGHTGFKGSWLALWLQHLGAHVTGFALAPETQTSHWSLLGLEIDEARADLCDSGRVQEALREFRPQIVFHLAAQSLVRRGYANAPATFATNVTGLVHLLEAVRRTPSVQALVNVTSDKCYENRETGQAYSEGDALGGQDPYSASKACAEIVSNAYRASFLASRPDRPVALATARAGNVIGGGDWADDRLVPDLVRGVLSGGPVAIRYPGATRPWQHVLEPLSGYLCLGQRLLSDGRPWSEAWNFGPQAQDHWPVGAVVDRFRAHWPDLRCEFSERSAPHEAARLHLDCSKVRERLHWRPVWGIETLIQRTARWYRNWMASGRADSVPDLLDYVQQARATGVKWAGS